MGRKTLAPKSVRARGPWRANHSPGQHRRHAHVSGDCGEQPRRPTATRHSLWRREEASSTFYPFFVDFFVIFGITKVLTMVWAPPPNPDPSLRRTSGEGWSVIAMRSHDQWRGRLGTETGCDARDRM
jgi:hypothetical protein